MTVTNVGLQTHRLLKYGAQKTMSRSGAKRKFRGTTPGRQNVRRLSDDDLMAQQPHRAWLPEARRMDAKAATPLGGLNLIGAITDNQYEAGQRYVVVVAEYRSSIGVPMEGYTSSGKGYACTGALRCEDCECRRRKDRYDRAFEAVSAPSQRAARAVSHVAVFGKGCQSDELAHLKIGLTALSRHFGIERAGQKF